MSFNCDLVTLGNMFFIKKIKLLVFYATLSALLSGCLGLRHLKKDQKLLTKQRIKGNESVSKEDLSNFHAQVPNRRILFMPFALYVSFYQWGINSYDTDKYEEKKEKNTIKIKRKIDRKPDKLKRTNRLNRQLSRNNDKIDNKIEEGNLLMRWGEPLAVFDSSQAVQTRSQMELFLKSKGFFHADVTYATKQLGLRKRRIKTTYFINEGIPYTIDSLIMDVKDSTVLKLLIANQSKSKLQLNKNYDQSNITDERDRITNLLKNSGYYDFNRQYVSFQVDSTMGKNGSRKVAIKTIIRNPIDRGYHRIFTIDSVNFFTDANLKISGGFRKTASFNLINYHFYSKKYSAKILDRRVFIYPGKIYSLRNTLLTQRQLANIDNFKFINVNYDSSGGKFIANIYTSPLSRYQISNEVGLNVTQGFPGPFYNFSLTKRNVFRSLENVELGARIGIEGVASAANTRNIYRSIEAGANLSFIFPQFLLPVSQGLRAKLGKFNPRTRIQLGYGFTDRPEYRRTNLTLSNNYSWENNRRDQFNIAFGEISVIRSDLEDDFRARLEELEMNGNNLINSFEPSFVSSIIFTGTFNFNNYGTFTTNSAYIRFLLESGGTLLNIGGTKILDDFGLEYYKFFKVSFDYRKHKPIDKNTRLAYKFTTGIAIPYSDNKILPYEKYFFAGGSNSVRGWRPRRLGPGSYTPLDSLGVLDYSFEQQGEIFLESSFEVRRKLFGIFGAALFLDIGNTWTLREDPTRPGAKFDFDDFFTEIAIAAGLGIRFDFSFLVLRFDAGLKVVDPARERGSRFIFSNGFNDPPFQKGETNPDLEPVIFNIGIGYPF